MPHTHIQILDHLKVHISYPKESCPSVNAKSNKCAVTPFASLKCVNVTMVAHLLHFFYQMASSHIYKVRCVAVTCYAKGELTGK